MTTDAVAELYSPAFFADPYRTFDALRDTAPLWWSEAAGAFVVTRYADCVEILNDFERFSDTDEDGSATQTSNANEHLRFRATVNRALGPEFMLDLEPKVQHIADHLIDTFIDDRETDFVRSVAYPLPT